MEGCIHYLMPTSVTTSYNKNQQYALFLKFILV